MRYSIYDQYAVILDDSAEVFSSNLNAKLRELKDLNAKVDFSESNPLCAYVRYTVKEEQPETVAESARVSGTVFVCSQCPYFHPVLKADGEEDKRCKWGDCEHAEFGRTYKNSEACEKLYKAIREREVKLCFTE